MEKRIFLLIGLLIFTGCQTIVSISNSDIEVKKGVPIAAVVGELSFFNLYTPKLSIVEQLAKKCPGGRVTGVETVLLKRELIILQDYSLYSTATCLNSLEPNR